MKLANRKDVIALLVGISIFAVAGVLYAKSQAPIPLKPVPGGSTPPPAAELIAPRSAGFADLPDTGAQRDIIWSWAQRSLGDWTDWPRHVLPRLLIAKLAIAQDLDRTNETLREGTPQSNVGSTWELHYGDHDFVICVLTTLLYLFGDQPDRLYPDALTHMLDKLLILDGGDPLVYVPRTFRLVKDTENHQLMMETSRYLKNQWLHEHGSPEQQADPRYDNSRNGLAQWLSDYLDEVVETGFYEFNSLNYLGYAFHPLLNLEAFAASPELAAKARFLLDRENWYYALGSLGMRRFVPFRRRPSRAGETRLTADPHTAFMVVWTAASDADAIASLDDAHMSFIATLTGYQLPDAVCDWTLRKPEEYLFLLGRGAKGSPEIHSGGPGYLLTAGGLSRGKRSLIVARPTVLMLNDGAQELEECFHIPGRGASYHDWNNTGVHKRFACGPAPVQVPAAYRPEGEHGGWQVFRARGDNVVLVGVHSADGLGIVTVFPDEARSAQEVARALDRANPDHDGLRTQFRWPDGGGIAYDPKAQKGTWVIESVDGASVDRDYGRWPKMGGDIPTVSFEDRGNEPIHLSVAMSRTALRTASSTLGVQGPCRRRNRRPIRLSERAAR